MSNNLTFEPGHWYAMTMYPGYTDQPYRSPIEVQSTQPLGSGQFRLEFWNVGYAAGVQMMEKKFRTLARAPGSLITQEVDVKQRTTIFEPLTSAWIAAFTPGFIDVALAFARGGSIFSQYHQRAS